MFTSFGSEWRFRDKSTGKEGKRNFDFGVGNFVGSVLKSSSINQEH